MYNTFMNLEAPLPADQLAPLAGRTPYQRAAEPLLLAGLATSLALGPILLLRLLSGRELTYLPLIAFLIALESVLTTRWLTHPDQRGLNRVYYRAAELIFILLVLRLFAWATEGNLPVAADLRGFLLNPISFIDANFFLLIIVTLFTWERAMTFASIFTGLILSADEITYYTLPPAARRQIAGELPPDSNRLQQVGRFIQHWTIGGMILLFCAALTTYELPRFVTTGSIDLRTIGRLGLHPTMLAALLLYFLVGFWLLSQARLSAMRVRWLADGVSAAPAITRTWHRSSLWLLLTVALVASLLPIGRTFAIARVLQATLGLFFFLLNLLAALLAFFVFLILSLFGSPQAGREIMEEAQPFVPPSLGDFQPPVQEPSLLMGGLFWLAVIAIAVMAVIFFLRQRGIPLDKVVNGRWWATLLAWWHTFWAKLTGRLDELGQAVRARLRQPAVEEAAPPWRFIRLNALSPREQVRYFYLAMTRRAAERGVARRPQETPLEYVRDLKDQWPEAEVDVDSLTDAFLEARYSPRPVEKEAVHPVKQTWQRVKSSLRRGKRAS
jgi:hypothetical protein